MRISIALATYNGAHYLQAQLDSLLAQVRLPDEVVIIDDCSRDETLSIIRRFADIAPFRVIWSQNHRNLGYGGNFNKALSKTTGDLVFICDQDDVWLPNKTLVMLRVFEANPKAVLIIHDLEFCTKNLAPIGQTKLERMSMGSDIQRDYVVGMATAIRGSFLRLCLPIPSLPGVVHDRWLHDCALAVRGKLVMNDVLAMYRRHGSNATATRAVNAGTITTRWTFLWRRFCEPSWLKSLEYVPESPLSTWLADRHDLLVSTGYLEPHEIDALIERENARTDVIRKRNRLLQLSRWRRIGPIVSLYRAGGYQGFFSWKSAIKDLVRR